TRILHWLTAALVFGALFVGFVMVNSLGGYGTLVGVHVTLGALILIVVVFRAANRFTHRTPPLPSTVGSVEQLLVVGSEIGLYVLLLAQPLVGWAMVSASGRPVVLFGFVPLPRIAPVPLTTPA
ncbi:cytochrome b, partial [Mycolicibacterium gadium]|uniref:cytochrome b n=1 Tax=Mycolicibacterium gadium TaxID=1794 RepID=UPI0021F2AD72